MQLQEIFFNLKNPDRQQIYDLQQRIRTFFHPRVSPNHFICYQSFCQAFEVHSEKNFRQQNLNIIDMHLKYREFVYEEMAPYKVIPVFVYSVLRLVRRKNPTFIFPFVYMAAFDYYFEPYFVWLHQKDKIINIRQEFVKKLSKFKNIQRRVQLFENLKQDLQTLSQAQESVETGHQQNDDTEKAASTEVPDRYLKFGVLSQYVAHSAISGNTAEMSTVLQSGLFKTSMSLRNFSLSWASIRSLGNTMLGHVHRFSEFRSEKPEVRKKCMIDLEHLVKFKDIAPEEISNLTARIQKRIRRAAEVYMFHQHHGLYFSDFTVDKLIKSYEHNHMIPESKYTIEGYGADFTIFSALISVPILLGKIFRR